MPADVLTFTDVVRAELQKAFDAAGAQVEVTREYEIEYDLGTFTGLKCHVMPTAYMRDSAATRKENNYDAECVVVIGERWTSTGRPTKQWLDDRVHLVERCVYDPLERIELPLLADQYWVREIECTTVYDMTMLRQQKVFWSEVEAVFRRLRPTKPR